MEISGDGLEMVPAEFHKLNDEDSSASPQTRICEDRSRDR